MSGERRDRDGRRAERREALLEAAIGAVRAHGPGVTMEQLAAAGGVTKPILYRHFGDREGLIAAIAERFSTELLAHVVTPLSATDAEPRQLLEATVDGYVAFVEREPSLYRFLVRQAAGRPDGHDRVGGLIDAIAKQVAVVIGEQLRALGADSGAAVPWAYGIIGFVHQASDWWLDDRTLPRTTLVTYLTSLLWDGLLGAAQAGAAADGASLEPTVRE
jgi:AcrR family transcriptional regulator